MEGYWIQSELLNVIKLQLYEGTFFHSISMTNHHNVLFLTYEVLHVWLYTWTVICLVLKRKYSEFTEKMGSNLHMWVSQVVYSHGQQWPQRSWLERPWKPMNRCYIYMQGLSVAAPVAKLVVQNVTVTSNLLMCIAFTYRMICI